VTGADHAGDSNDASNDASNDDIHDDDSAFEDIEELFDDFLARLEEGGTEDFDQFAARHPEHSEQLHDLYASWSRLDAQLESALPESIIDESFFHGTEPGSGLSGDTPPAPPATSGTIVADDFRLLKIIGKGGMGHVWEAEQRSLGRRVALKLIRPGRGDPGDPAALAREARAGGRLNHPGIVTVYAAGAADGVHYIAQELVGEGFTLADFIERRRGETLTDGRTYRKIATLFALVAEAVETAHQAGILHRDLKPSNILIGDNDLPKVSDFGLAHLAVDGGRTARPGFLGTWAYMSPEQAAGKDIAIDHRSDIFSLGAVFYEALTLRRAFDGDTGEQIIEQVVHTDPPDLRTIRSRIPGDLALICQAALAKNRGDRYQSMADFAGDLRRFLNNEPIEARPQGVATRALKWSRRHPAWTTALVLVSLALVVISSLLLNEVTLRRQAQDSKMLADDRTLEAQRQSYLANVRSAVMNLERGRNTEARTMLAACLPDQRGWEWHHYSLAADLSRLHLRGHTAPVRSVAANASGNRVLSGSDDGTARLWDGLTGETLQVFADHGGPVSAVAMSASGDVFVTATHQGTVALWAGPTPFTRESLGASGLPVTSLSISASGNLICAADSGGGITVWDRSHNSRYQIAPDSSSSARSIRLSSDGSTLVAGSRYGQISYYDLRSGKPNLRLDWWLQDDVQAHVAVGISANGSRIFAGLVDGTVVSWSADHVGDVIFNDADGNERTLALDPAPYDLHINSESGLLSLWNPTVTDGNRPLDGTPLEALVRGASLNLSLDDVGRLLVSYPESNRDHLKLVGHTGPVDELVLAADGNRLVSASSEEGSIRIWDVSRQSEVLALTGQGGEIHALAMSANGATIIAGCGNNEAVVWMGDTLGASVALPSLEQPANAVAISGDGNTILSSSIFENVARVWDGVTGDLRLTLPGHPIGVTSLALSDDGKTLATGSYDKHVRIWDGETGEQRTVLVGHGRGITSVACDGSGERVVSGSHDKTTRLWDTTTGRAIAVLNGSRSPVTSVAIDRSGQTIAAGSEDGRVRIWRAPWITPVLLREGSWGDDGTVSLSRDGMRIAWASAQDDLVLVWDTETGKVIRRFSGTRSHVVASALSDTGEWLLWASAGDQGVRLTHVDTGEVRAVLPRHDGPVTAIAFGEQSGRILTAGRTGQLRIWESEKRRAQALWSGLAARR
jgi:WD40 repeat protein/serine/threonine protein kinase